MNEAADRFPRDARERRRVARARVRGSRAHLGRSGSAGGLQHPASTGGRRRNRPGSVCPRLPAVSGIYGSPQQFRAWIVRVTWRLAIDRWRADRRRSAREQVAGENDPGPNAEEEAVRAERSALLWKAIDALPDKLRSVLIPGRAPGTRHPRSRAAAGHSRRHGEVPVVPGPERAGREPDMSCERFSEAIAGHAAGGEISAAAAAHQASCESCAARLATQRRLLTDVDAELARTLSLSASPEFVARVTSRVTAPGRSVVWRPAAVWVGLAAAAAIAVGGGPAGDRRRPCRR